ncbi:hypothetical protein CIHG_00942 [Coccidioides immitis H538.4]|uniref:Uncharacterized protein n=2 Tax=Coccidioides immitis TaxID=5501 RepID=A0A0J8RDA8_COCIT|nr:hypothetical protein CIRG_03359 [Coccidioides immitis RMSCC 2394]KMU83160.1 hypothetical protein CIHG_00942 [Coccidioides immitis H538.4]
MEHISTTALAITVPDEYSSGARGYALHMKDKKRSFKWGRQISLIILRTFNSRLGKPRPFCVPERALKVGEIAADSVVNTLMFYVVESANYVRNYGVRSTLSAVVKVWWVCGVTPATFPDPWAAFPFRDNGRLSLAGMHDGDLEVPANCLIWKFNLLLRKASLCGARAFLFVYPVAVGGAGTPFSHLQDERLALAYLLQDISNSLIYFI